MFAFQTYLHSTSTSNSVQIPGSFSELGDKPSSSITKFAFSKYGSNAEKHKSAEISSLWYCSSRRNSQCEGTARVVVPVVVDMFA